jgi:hypothetical protein
MAAANANRDGQRQPGEFLHYTGASGCKYYKDTLIIKAGASGARIIPLTLAGSSQGYFIGVANNQVDLTAGLGASQAIINVWSRGEFTFEANGTGVSAHIGMVAFGLDDQTVGVSVSENALAVGRITGLVSTSQYRVLIDTGVAVRGASSYLLNANI